MGAIAKVAKFFGIVTVKTRGNQVRISGIDGLVMARYIKQIFETDRVNKIMFTSYNDTSMSIHEFFIPDLVFILSKIRHHPKCGWSGKRTIDKIVEGILKNTWFGRTVQEHPSMIDPKRMSLLKWKPMPKQLEFLHAYGQLMPKYDLRGYILALGPGGGKFSDLNSLILTPSGWVRMGDIKLGQMVCTPDGGTAPVIGIYPQGMKDIYTVELEDGRKARCGLEHLWRVYHPDFENGWSVLTLDEIIRDPRDLKIPVVDETTLIMNDYLSIKDITLTSHELAQCIAVDHPDHLYICDDYIVTHNTFTDLLVATCVVPPSIAEVKIIISPKKALHLVWEDSIRKVFHKTPNYWVCDSGIPMPRDKCEYYVFNYESLDKALELADSLKLRGIRYFVIVDETHNFADPRSGRTQKLVDLQTKRDDIYFIWTSGTPILKKGSELISFLKCADRRFDIDAQRIFKRIYDTSPGKAGEIFQHRLGQQMAFLVPKSEFSDTKPIIKELPVKLPKNISDRFLMSTVREDMKTFIKERLEVHKANLSMYRKTVDKWLSYHERTLSTRAELKEFDQYKKNIAIISRHPDKMLTELLADAKRYERTKLFPSLPPTSRKEFRSSLSAIKNIKLKVRGEALGTVLSKRRSECAAYLGLYCKPDKIMKESLSKTLFFASSVEPILELDKFLKKKGFIPVTVYGGSGENLTKQINDFTDIPELNPVCATMQSLSEAVPVVAASTVVLLNRPFRDAHAQQVFARADRIGQIHQVTVYLVTLDTGDEPNVSSTTDAIFNSVREDINILVGDAFISFKDEDKSIVDIVDASKEYDYLQKQEASIGLY